LLRYYCGQLMIKINQQAYNFNSQKKKTRLNDLIKLYEINYLKINKILPNILNNNNASFSLPEGEKSSVVNINVFNESKYTSKLIVCQSNFSISSMENMIMEVAIYHDLRMVEVRRFNGKHQFWSRNVFPNKNMLSKDEKYQWNKYLSEWLGFVTREGLSNIRIN
jgi:uncharacterized protein YqiB (DUF1249 family)